MPRDPAALLDEALRLPAASRARLAAQLLGSLDDAGPLPDEQQYAEAWGAEIERRIRDVESGAVKPVPWETVRERLATEE